MLLLFFCPNVFCFHVFFSLHMHKVVMGVDSPDDCAVVAVGGNHGGKQMFNIHSVFVF
jgi:hypothetical protein